MSIFGFGRREPIGKKKIRDWLVQIAGYKELIATEVKRSSLPEKEKTWLLNELKGKDYDEMWRRLNLDSV